MGEVIKFFPRNAADDPDAVLQQAEGQYDDVMIVGISKIDGDTEVRCSTGISKMQALWMVTILQHRIMNGDYDD